MSADSWESVSSLSEDRFSDSVSAADDKTENNLSFKP